ncbi:MAG: hypothetical protein Q8R47_01260 [Nanoarchaeota archaeon]|nr:hypothetical protein [Nanoarchaeota archaeon]
MAKVIWRDVHWFRIIIIIIWSLMFLFYIVGIIKYFTFSSDYNSLLMLGLGLFFIYGFLGLLLPSTTFITTDGIRIGNVPNDVYSTVRIKQKPTLIEWDRIKEIKIIRKEVRHNYILVLRNFLVLVTSDRKKYQTFLANPEGFKEKLKKLNKSNLLKK